MIQKVRIVVSLYVCGWLTAAALAAASSPLPASRQIDIGHGRKVYLTCAGPLRPRQPTVVLVSGYHDSSDPWVNNGLLRLAPGAAGPAVFPGLATQAHVCAYDRPGTIRYIAGFPLTERSTPVRQPRTVVDLARELHGVLSVAKVPGPYILVGHSLGGLLALTYARIYPENIRGIVFVDAFSPTIPQTLGSRWPLYRRILNPSPQKQLVASLALKASESVEIDRSLELLRHVRPLGRLPVVVLTKTRSFGLPSKFFPKGITIHDVDAAYERAQQYFVKLSPGTPQIFARGSEHYIQLRQPDLVIRATRIIIRRAAHVMQ